MNFSLNPFKIYSDIENGHIYIRPLNIFLVLLVIAIDVLLVNILEPQLLNLFKIIKPENEFIFNAILFILQLLAGLISLNIIIFFIKDKSPDINYSSNSLALDFVYVVLLILGFRFLYEGSFYQLKTLLSIDFRVNSILLSCVYAPFIEEMMYRGIVLNGLLKKYSVKIALFSSSLIFGLMHFSFLQGINAFLIGLIIGYVFIKTKSLYLCIFIHFCNNFIVMYLPTLSFDSLFMSILYDIFNVLLGIFLIVLSLKKMNLKKRKKVYSDYDESFNFFIDE